MKGIPREVGSLKKKQPITNSGALRLLRKRLALDSHQKEILVGMILGDAHLERSGWNKKYRLQLVQGNSQKDYLFWKFEQFRNCCASAPSYQRWNRSWLIRTVSHPIFTGYAQWFYKDKRKIIPKDIINHLTPLNLAIWFMDDGALGSRGIDYILNTQSFSYEENEYLAFCLRKKFSLETVTLNRDKKWWRLYIGRKSQDTFTRLVSPYIIPSMQYKLRALDPVETTRRPLLDRVKI